MSQRKGPLFYFCLGCLIATGSLFFVLKAKALAPKNAPYKPQGPFFSQGSQQGGRSLAASSIVNLEFLKSKKRKHEALVFKFGDVLLRERPGLASYFQVVLDRSGRQIVIDLAEVQRFGVNRQTIDARLRRSEMIESHRWLYDPLAPSTQLILKFKQPISFRAHQRLSKTKASGFVVEWKPQINKAVRKDL